MRLLTASNCCSISAARSATCPSGPSSRSPASSVTCWPTRGFRCRRTCARPATRMRSCGSACPGLPRPGRPGRGRDLPAGDPRRRGRPALPGLPVPAGRPGLGQHHRRRVPGGDQALSGPPVPAPDGPGPAGHRTARCRPGPARAHPDPHAARGAARGLRRGDQYPDGIRAARQAGARPIGYACTAAAREQLTAAGADAITDSMTELAGAAYYTDLWRRHGRRRGPGR